MVWSRSTWPVDFSQNITGCNGLCIKLERKHKYIFYKTLLKWILSIKSLLIFWLLHIIFFSNILFVIKVKIGILLGSFYSFTLYIAIIYSVIDFVLWTYTTDYAEILLLQIVNSFSIIWRRRSSAGTYLRRMEALMETKLFCGAWFEYYLLVWIVL